MENHEITRQRQREDARGDQVNAGRAHRQRPEVELLSAPKPKASESGEGQDDCEASWLIPREENEEDVVAVGGIGLADPFFAQPERQIDPDDRDERDPDESEPETTPRTSSRRSLKGQRSDNFGSRVSDR